MENKDKIVLGVKIIVGAAMVTAILAPHAPRAIYNYGYKCAFGEKNEEAKIKEERKDNDMQN